MQCPNCNQPSGAPDWKAREHIKWANAHGRGTRLFCDNCGQWTDFILTQDYAVVDHRIVKPPKEDK